MKKTTINRLKDAKQVVDELTTDHDRLRDFVKNAEQRLRDARRGDEVAMKKAALEVAGLREALADVTRERDEAAKHLAELEQRARIEADEAEVAEIRSKLDQLHRDAVASINQAADAALDSLQKAASISQEARRLHGRMASLLEALGQPVPASFRPVGYREALAARDNAVAEDEVFLQAIVAAAATHPVARGRSREEVGAERDERRARARAAQYRTQWETRAALANGEHGANAETADAARAWLASNPRPAEVSA